MEIVTKKDLRVFTNCLINVHCLLAEYFGAGFQTFDVSSNECSHKNECGHSLLCNKITFFFSRNEATF